MTHLDGGYGNKLYSDSLQLLKKNDNNKKINLMLNEKAVTVCYRLGHNREHKDV